MARPKDPSKRIALALEGVEISVEQLANKMGIKRPTLLYHFPTYGSIAEEAIRHYITEAQAHLAKRLQPFSHPIDRVYQHALAVAEFQRGKEARFVFLTHLIASTSGQRIDHVAQVTAMHLEAHRTAMIKQLQDGMREGTVAPCDASAIVMMVRALADGLLILRVSTKANTTPVYDVLWGSVLEPLRLAPSGKTAKTSPRGKGTSPVARR